VLVAVGAMALNHRDKMVIESGRRLPLSFPFTPGSNLAGRIAATGEDAERFAIGDRVTSCFTPDWADLGEACTRRGGAVLRGKGEIGHDGLVGWSATVSAKTRHFSSQLQSPPPSWKPARWQAFANGC
jgi:NADPH:quinone reductase-like Zn-dependent oxidoreductase